MSNIKMGKSGALRVTTVAAARALMTQDMVTGRRETPAPKVADFLKNRKRTVVAA
jgi:hypothetical protein